MKNCKTNFPKLFLKANNGVSEADLENGPASFMPENGSDNHVLQSNANAVRQPLDSYSAEKQRESDTPRTLHAVVNDGNNPDANVKLSDNKVTQNTPIVKNNISEDSEDYSIPATSNFEELLEAYENDDISRQEYLDALKKRT